MGKGAMKCACGKHDVGAKVTSAVGMTVTLHQRLSCDVYGTLDGRWQQVRPIENSGGHFFHNCWCKPKVEEYDGGTVTIHNYEGH